MATVSPTGFDVDRLRHQVRATYERVASEPDGDFHFHRGGTYAVDYLDYDPFELSDLPSLTTARFAGVGNPHRIGPIYAGETVLDHACGSGTDLFIAAKKVGPRGRAIGVDMTASMRAIARNAAREAGLGDVVDIRAGYFESLPVHTNSVDVVISNGVLNLAPDKARVFREIYRVLKPGGRLYLADVAVARELRADTRSNPDLWAACIAGALPEDALLRIAEESGLVDARLTECYDCFRNTRAQARVSQDLHVHGVNLYARKPVPSA